MDDIRRSMHAPVCIHVYVCMYIHTYIHIYIYIYIYARKNVFTHENGVYVEAVMTWMTIHTLMYVYV
jgi:hypothetical protein